ncbi:hypothetical protein ABZ801_26455 [Actinomadura sp. NPDC047616]|uniref:hypothetical protein n=1 Tax=Actinomadura sp. NPDC047616 TaxID=3155914 RepID=UPI0033D4660D
MDLESELRTAMAEHTAGTSAPPSLAAVVRRRHRRRVVRIRVTVGAAVAAAVAAFVVTPAYNSMTHVDPAGMRETPAGSPTAASPDRPVPPPAPGLPASPPSAERPGAGASGKPEADRPPAPAHRDEPGGAPGPVRRPDWVTYLPPGLNVDRPCAERGGGGDRTTTCRWSGGSGWVEIRVVRGTGLSGPEDLGGDGAPSMPRHTSVHGVRAVVSDRPDSGRQVAWMARPGVGVVVAAGGSARDQLMRVAEGVRV